MDMNERGGGNAGRRGDTGRRRIKGRKKWDNCNSIINKIYLKKKKKKVVWWMPGAGGADRRNLFNGYGVSVLQMKKFWKPVSRQCKYS